jgi:transposase
VGGERSFAGPDRGVEGDARGGLVDDVEAAVGRSGSHPQEAGGTPGRCPHGETGQGKQPGAAGKTLERRRPDRRIGHEPPACSCCGADLSDALVVGTEIRQVIDLPQVKPTVTDHVVYRCRCACGTETAGDMPPEARAPVCWGAEVRAFALYLLNRQHLPVERTAELLADVLGAPVSTGWLCNLQAETAGKLAPFITEMKRRLATEPVICADKTGTRVRTPNSGSTP